MRPDNYKATKSVPKDYTCQQKKSFYKETNHYLCDKAYLFEINDDGLISWYFGGQFYTKTVSYMVRNVLNSRKHVTFQNETKCFLMV